MSPMQLSIRLMKDEGYQTFIVEHWDAHAHCRRDLFGMFDLLALRRDRIVGVQTTSATNVSARIRKLTNHENIGIVREAGIVVEVHGWSKKENRWSCRREDLS